MESVKFESQMSRIPRVYAGDPVGSAGDEVERFDGEPAVGAVPGVVAQSEVYLGQLPDRHHLQEVVVQPQDFQAVQGSQDLDALLKEGSECTLSEILTFNIRTNLGDQN